MSISHSCCQVVRYHRGVFLRICYPKVNEKKARKVDTKLENDPKIKVECKEELKEDNQETGTVKVKTEIKQERSTKVMPLLLELTVFSWRISPWIDSLMCNLHMFKDTVMFFSFSVKASLGFLDTLKCNHMLVYFERVIANAEPMPTAVLGLACSGTCVKQLY